MSKMNIRKGDTVVVLSGADKNYRGTVLAAFPKEGKVLVEGVNMATKHAKPRSQTDTGGIRTVAMPLRVCKVMRVCPKCKQPTRSAHVVHEDGTRTRVCKKCGENI